jgi:catechol 2,3-dioxygenase-like lactoylglutathione lyase family enzyme
MRPFVTNIHDSPFIESAPARGEAWRQGVMRMAQIDHIILRVNHLERSVAFYTEVLGFTLEGTEGPFTVIRVNPDFQIQLAPFGTPGNEHYAFALSRTDFEAVYTRVRERGIPNGPTFHAVGTNAGLGRESGARGSAPTLYFNDPNDHLLEIRTYEE